MAKKKKAAVQQAVQPSGMQGMEAVPKGVSSLYPIWNQVESRERLSVGLPATAGSYFSFNAMKGYTTGVEDGTSVSSYGFCSSDKGTEKKIMPILPVERGARYAILHTMALDPTIHCALQMHIANALSPKLDTGESIYIESVDGKPDKIVDDLKATLTPYIQSQLNEWAWKTAIFGTCFSRVYGAQGKGITGIRTDYYTHPRYVQKFSKGGKLAGYTTNYQGTKKSHEGIKLLPPWYFVSFDIPEFWDNEITEPLPVLGLPVDLSEEDYEEEGLVESQDYGMSLLAPAYAPWLDLLDSVCSLRMSRRNAARLERIIGVNVGKLDPERAARYLSMIAERVSGASAELEKQSWLEGSVQTVVNHIIPSSADKGSLQIDAVQGTPDINGLEDVMFHVKRLGAALGIDPAMLGFGDLLSGGLGDGGFFRVSIQAGSKAQFLRTAIKNGLERLCELHVAYKYGKFFTPSEKPWQISFASISSALEQEAQANLQTKVGNLQGVVQTFGLIDQELGIADKRELCRLIWNGFDYPVEQFDEIFPEKQAENAQAAQDGAPAEPAEGGEGADAAADEEDLEEDEDWDDEGE